MIWFFAHILTGSLIFVYLYIMKSKDFERTIDDFMWDVDVVGTGLTKDQIMILWFILNCLFWPVGVILGIIKKIKK